MDCFEGWTSILQSTEGFTLSCGKNAAFTSANQTLLGMGAQRLRDQALKSNCESFLLVGRLGPPILAPPGTPHFLSTLFMLTFLPVF